MEAPVGGVGTQERGQVQWPGERTEDQWYEYLYGRYVRGAGGAPPPPEEAARRQYRASERLQLLAVHTHDQYRHPHRLLPVPGCALSLRCPPWRRGSLCACTLWPCTCGGAQQPRVPPAPIPKGPERGAAGSSALFLRKLVQAASEGCECALRPTGPAPCAADRLGFVCDRGHHGDFETRRLTRIMMDVTARDLGLFTERFEFQLDPETGARSVSTQTYLEVDDESLFLGAGKELWGGEWQRAGARSAVPAEELEEEQEPREIIGSIKTNPQEVRPLLVWRQRFRQIPAVRGTGPYSEGAVPVDTRAANNARRAPLAHTYAETHAMGSDAGRRPGVLAYWSTGDDTCGGSSESIASCHCGEPATGPQGTNVPKLELLAAKFGVRAPLPAELRRPLTADGAPPLTPVGATPAKYVPRGGRYVPLPAPREPGLPLHDTRGVKFSVHELPAYPPPKRQTMLRRALQFTRWDAVVSASRLVRWVTGQPRPPYLEDPWTPLPPTILQHPKPPRRNNK